jgi:hypothetical protein
VSKLQIALGLVLAAFSFETAWAINHYGFVGVFREILGSPAGGLAFFDLAIALSLVTVWMWRDARERGASFWPYALLTAALGSVGPLLYLIRRESALRATSGGAAPAADPVRATG